MINLAGVEMCFLVRSSARCLRSLMSAASMQIRPKVGRGFLRLKVVTLKGKTYR